MSAVIETNTGRGFFGHPWGLSTLFFTEMWERFSYYGMRAILFLYMTAKIENGGLEWKESDAGPIVGLYAASVYFLPLIGGWIADRFIGAKRATLIGAVIIMFGHFSLAIPMIPFFYVGLILVAVGTGFLKSNISAMVGDLYSKEDVRRDAGFSVFYMGINTGATAAPLVCGWFAQSASFKGMIIGWGLDPNSCWHFGFAAAGVGMFFGIIQYLLGAKNLRGVGEPPVDHFAESQGKSQVDPIYIAVMIGIIVLCVAIIAGFAGFAVIGGASLNDAFAYALKFVLMPVVLVGGLVGVLVSGIFDRLTLDEWKRMGIIFVLFSFSTIFWMGFEQASTSFNAFADKLTDNRIFGWEFPASWLQTVNPGLIILFAPIVGYVWLKLGKRQPSDPAKFSIGLVFGGLGYVVVAYAALLTASGKVSPLWLCLVYFLHTIGELCLSPVGLSSMTKLAPPKMVSLMLGIWFLSISMGNYIAGRVAGEFVQDPNILSGIFRNVALIMIGSGVVLAIIAPLVNRLNKRDTLPAGELELESH